MPRQLVLLLAAIGFSLSCHAQVSTPELAPSSACHSNVECKGLFVDLLTDKFVLRFPRDKWEIFVHADTYVFGDGKATSHAVVGVVPVSKDRFGYFPRQTSSHIVTTPRANSAFDKEDVERKTIRRAVERLMANCDKQKDCDLD